MLDLWLLLAEAAVAPVKNAPPGWLSQQAWLVVLGILLLVLLLVIALYLRQSRFVPPLQVELAERLGLHLHPENARGVYQGRHVVVSREEPHGGGDLITRKVQRREALRVVMENLMRLAGLKGPPGVVIRVDLPGRGGEQRPTRAAAAAARNRLRECCPAEGRAEYDVFIVAKTTLELALRGAAQSLDLAVELLDLAIHTAVSTEAELAAAPPAPGAIIAPAASEMPPPLPFDAPGAAAAPPPDVAAVWRRAIVGAGKSWVLFGNETVVVLPGAAGPEAELAATAERLLAEWGRDQSPVATGGCKAIPLAGGVGWAITCSHPDILTFVGPRDLAGAAATTERLVLAGHFTRLLDVRSPLVVHVENRSAAAADPVRPV